MPENDPAKRDAQENRFARHPLRWLAAIVIVGVIAVVGVTELVLAQMDLPADFRAGATQRYIRLREWAPNSAFVETPPQARFLNPGGPVRKQYRIETDRLGFIKPTRVHDDPEVEVVFLGGSTTEALFVTAEKRFPYLAGRLLEARTGKRVNSYNGGKSGNNVTHSTFVLHAKVLPMAPQFVVLMHAVNDIAVLQREGGYWTRHPDFRHIVVPDRDIESAFRAVRDSVIPRTYRLLRGAFRRASLSPFGRTAYAQPTPPPPLPADGWGKSFRSALLAFVRTAQAWHIRPVLMTQAFETGGVRMPGKDDGGAYLAPGRLARAGFTAASFRSTHAFFNAITRDVARETGAMLIDLERAYPWSRNELYDGLHFSDAGSEIVARIVAGALAPAVEALPAKQ